MTIAQIIAIVSLLLAFGVDQPTVDNVQSILENKSAIVSPMEGIGVPTEAATSTPILMGKSIGGLDVFKSETGDFYTVDPETGCHKSILALKNKEGLYNQPNTKVVYCPANK